MKACKIGALIIGSLILLSSFAHFFLGFPAINKSIEIENVSAEISEPFRIIWIYSSITMLLIGIWTLFISADLGKGIKKAWWQAFCISTGYILFGIIGFVNPYPNYHLLMFAIIGTIQFIPLMFFKKSFK